MKDNSKKILCWLYPAANDQVVQSRKRRVPVADLEWLLMDLSAAGRRSLVRLLEKNRLIFSDQLQGEQYLTLSSHGQAQLEAQFPVLQMSGGQWDGSWTQLLFLDAPESDASFRYLRQLLVSNNWLSLKRGVYLYPGQLPALIEQTLDEVYVGHVAVVSFDQWQFGDERIIIGQATQLNDLKDLYSGISREATKLLSNFAKTNAFNHQRKKQFYSLFDRLYQSLGTDLGLLSYFYPGATTGLQILARMQQQL